MRENPYLIRMDIEEDCNYSTYNATSGIYYRQFNWPVLGAMKDEFDCMQFDNGEAKPVGYHEHSFGTETFMISQGKFLCYCMGDGFYMEPGDLLHIQPWMGHSFTPIEPNSRLNIMFMGINQFKGITENRQRLTKNFPGVYESEEFQKMFGPWNGNAGARTFPAENIVEPEKVSQLRKDGVGIREHDFGCIKLLLKIAKYETMGEKEVWDLYMKKGFFCDWDNFVPEYRMFWVMGGKIHCSVKTSATETCEFDAVADNTVVVPPYTPFRFEVVEDAHVRDLDCPARLQDLCEELEAWKANNPDAQMDKEEMIKLFRSFDFSATDVGCKG